MEIKLIKGTIVTHPITGEQGQVRSWDTHPNGIGGTYDMVAVEWLSGLTTCLMANNTNPPTRPHPDQDQHDQDAARLDAINAAGVSIVPLSFETIGVLHRSQVVRTADSIEQAVMEAEEYLRLRALYSSQVPQRATEPEQDEPDELRAAMLGAEAYQLDHMELQSATCNGYALKTYDDGSGPLWAYEETTGVCGMVRADTFESAWGCVTDEILSPIDVEDIPEAYGLDLIRTGSTYELYREEDGRSIMIGGYPSREDAHQAAVAWLREQDDVTLVEGYEYQSSGTGTGIVQLDLNHHGLGQVTEEYLDLHHIKLQIVVDD